MMKSIRREGEDITRDRRSIVADGFYWVLGFGRAKDTAKNAKKIEVLEQDTRIIGSTLRRLVKATDKTFAEMSGKLGEVSDRQRQNRGAGFGGRSIIDGGDSQCRFHIVKNTCFQVFTPSDLRIDFYRCSTPMGSQNGASGIPNQTFGGLIE